MFWSLVIYNQGVGIIGSFQTCWVRTCLMYTATQASMRSSRWTWYAIIITRLSIYLFPANQHFCIVFLHSRSSSSRGGRLLQTRISPPSFPPPWWVATNERQKNRDKTTSSTPGYVLLPRWRESLISCKPCNRLASSVTGLCHKVALFASTKWFWSCRVVAFSTF